jgi:hypothetical protein
MSKKSLTTFFVGLIIGSVSLSYAAWTGPTQAPPNGNTAAPINISSVAQDKSGVLTVGGLGVFGSALITSSAGYTLPSSLQLGVNGKIGAKQYCDEKGNNCVSTLGGGVNVVSGTVSSGGQPIVCGGWDVKYGTTAPINGWGCGSEASCPSGYDTIKSSKVTINLAEQTNLCVLHSSGGGSSGGDQIVAGWPNKILCEGTGQKSVLYINGVSGVGFPQTRVTYTSFADVGAHTQLQFNYANGDYLDRAATTDGYSKSIDACVAKGNIKNQKGFN